MFRRITVDRNARRPLGLVVLGVTALAGLFYSVSGYAMAGSYTSSNPEQLGHWQRVAAVYLACAGISALIVLGAMVTLFRRGRHPRRSDPPTA